MQLLLRQCTTLFCVPVAKKAAVAEVSSNAVLIGFSCRSKFCNATCVWVFEKVLYTHIASELFQNPM